jgi:hypothetical protein
MGEFVGHTGPDLNEAWEMDQQNRMLAFEESKSRAVWTTEFGSSLQLSSPGPSVPQHMAARPDCV